MSFGNILIYVLYSVLIQPLLVNHENIPLKNNIEALIISSGIVLVVMMYSTVTQYNFILKINQNINYIVLFSSVLIGLNKICENDTQILYRSIHYLSITLLITLFSILHIFLTQWALFTWYYPSQFNSSTCNNIMCMFLNTICVYACCLRLFI